jgi:L-ascorbate metabolism protein UlaG (beta-lactamase superfamily)
VPARHGPVGCEPVTGVVTGFVLRGEGLPTVYVSGDNAAVELVEQIVDRSGPVDVAVLFAGAARTPLLDGAPLTLTVPDAVEAARLLDPAVIVPVHTEGWAHFSEGPELLAAGFAAAGLSDRLRIAVAGKPLVLDVHGV